MDHYRALFRFVFVDEYQDINHAQYRLVRLLSPHGDNLCVIGDPDQAIYGFRGADSRYFLRFKNDYPEAEIVCLEQNYRSSETILNASTSLINQNRPPRENPLWSGISGESFLSVAAYPTDRAEAESIVHTIEQLMGGTSHFSLDSGRVDGAGDPEIRSFSDFAVFYRLHSQGEVLEEAFERSGLPFRRIGGEALAKHPRARQVLELLVKRRGEVGIPYAQSDRSGTAPEGARADNSLVEIVTEIIESLGFDPEEETMKALMRQAEVGAGDTAEFLAQMALKSDLDALDPRAERVTLMTLHASKGLEFPVVFIVGCEANLLPYRPEGRPPSPEEEERRLFYVGLTRSREKIFLTRAHRRTLFGRTRVQEPSPFLKEIEDHLRQVTVSPRKPLSEKNRTQLNLF